MSAHRRRRKRRRRRKGRRSRCGWGSGAAKAWEPVPGRDEHRLLLRRTRRRCSSSSSSALHRCCCCCFPFDLHLNIVRVPRPRQVSSLHQVDGRALAPQMHPGLDLLFVRKAQPEGDGHSLDLGARGLCRPGAHAHGPQHDDVPPQARNEPARVDPADGAQRDPPARRGADRDFGVPEVAAVEVRNLQGVQPQLRQGQRARRDGERLAQVAEGPALRVPGAQREEEVTWRGEAREQQQPGPRRKLGQVFAQRGREPLRHLFEPRCRVCPRRGGRERLDRRARRGGRVAQGHAHGRSGGHGRVQAPLLLLLLPASAFNSLLAPCIIRGRRVSGQGSRCPDGSPLEAAPAAAVARERRQGCSSFLCWLRLSFKSENDEFVSSAQIFDSSVSLSFSLSLFVSRSTNFFRTCLLRRLPSKRARGGGKATAGELRAHARANEWRAKMSHR